MEVILLERVEKLGQMGDRVRVKDGFARNYLLPQRKALRATENNLKHFATQRVELEARNLARRQDAEAISKKLEGFTVTLLRQASDTALLYGSVNARDIAVAVSDGGFALDKSQVQLTQPIKALGIHQVQLRLHPEVAIPISVNVARSEAEAEMQAAGGKTSAEAFFEEGAAPVEVEGETSETEAQKN